MFTLKYWHLNESWSTGKMWASGLMYGHPDYEDGTSVRTSYIVSKETLDDGYRIVTRSGSVYFLPFESEI